MLDALVDRWEATQCELVTAVYPIQSTQQLFSPNTVKVVRLHNGAAHYFSRAPLPHVRDAEQANWLEHNTFWGHIGVYGYSRKALEAYPTLAKCPLENLEKLEQLRYIDAGYTFQTIEWTEPCCSIDTQEDLDHARNQAATLEKVRS